MLKDKLKTFVNHATALYNYIYETEAREIKCILSREQATEEFYDGIKNGEELKIVSLKNRAPYFLQPREKELFLYVRRKLSKIRVNYTGAGKGALLVLEAYNERHSSKRKTTYIMDIASLRSHLRQMKEILPLEEYKEMIAMFISELEKRNVNIHIIKEPSLYHLLITDKKVIVCHISEKDVLGVAMRGSDMVNAYSDLFNSYVKDAVPITPYLKQELRYIVIKNKKNKKFHRVTAAST